MNSDNLTRRERRSVANLLRRARPFIENGGETFICHALYVARGASERANKRRTTQYQYNIVWAVTSLIRNRMSGYMTLEDWLRWEHRMPPGALTTENMRDYRLAWMDALINEFEGEKK